MNKFPAPGEARLLINMQGKQMTAIAYASAFGLEQSTANRYFSGLKDNGYLELFTTEHVGIGRRGVYQLTDQGKALVEFALKYLEKPDDAG